jgi:hypothetical protein
MRRSEKSVSGGKKNVSGKRENKFIGIPDLEWYHPEPRSEGEG